VPTSNPVAVLGQYYTITDNRGRTQRWLAAPLLEPDSCRGCCLYRAGDWIRLPECVHLRNRSTLTTTDNREGIPTCRSGRSCPGVIFKSIETDEAGNPLPQPLSRKWPKFLPD